jgi:cation diffusion facilitator family transporter
MSRPSECEFPPQLAREHRRATWLAWISIANLFLVIVLLYVTMGSSQAMKTNWVEKMLGLVAPVSFLIASRLRRRPHDHRFPYGYHRAVSIGFLLASAALLTAGLALIFDAAEKLVQGVHPSIGSVRLAGQTIWLGWLMLPALAYAGTSAIVLGLLKLRPARKLHDKVLYADAEMGKADWLTDTAAMAGIVGIAFGWWWADAAAALVMSCDVVYDGWRNVTAVVADLMDRVPRTVDHKKDEKLPARLETALRRLPWVSDVRVRMREAGHVFLGEAFIVPADQRQPLARIQEAIAIGTDLDWRVHELTVQLVAELPTNHPDDPHHDDPAPADAGAPAARPPRSLAVHER